MNKINFKAYVNQLNIIWAVLILALALNLWNMLGGYQKKIIVSFDLKGTEAEFIKETAQLKLSAHQLKLLTRHFDKALSHSLKSYAIENNVVILVKPAIIEGAQDISPEIQAMIAKRLRGKTSAD